MPPVHFKLWRLQPQPSVLRGLRSVATRLTEQKPQQILTLSVAILVIALGRCLDLGAIASRFEGSK
jgi:hypothetical protein